MIFQSPQNPNSHFTAKERYAPSFPTKYLLNNGKIKGRLLDFGCGLGVDVDFLQKKGFDISGYDPFYLPTLPTGGYDTIICNYVLNVLLPEEQSYVLMAISELLNPSGRAYFSVRRDVIRSGFRTHLIHGCQVYQCNVVLPYVSILRNNYCEIYEYRHFTQQKHAPNISCMLCSPSSEVKLITESALAYAFFIHASDENMKVLIAPKQHVDNYFDMSQRNKIACWMLVDRVRTILVSRNLGDSFSVKINVGKLSGQEYDHAYIVLQPCPKEKL